MYAVLVVLLAGLAFCIVVRIPVNTSAVVLVTEMPAGSPGASEDVRVGDAVRVALPGEKSRTPMRLRWGSAGPRTPRAVIDGYRLALGQAKDLDHRRLVVPVSDTLARAAGVACGTSGAATLDAMIAATAATRGVTLLTADPGDMKTLADHFRALRIVSL